MMAILFCFFFCFGLIWFGFGWPTNNNKYYDQTQWWWWRQYNLSSSTFLMMMFWLLLFFLWLVGRGFDFDFNFLCFLFSVSVFSGFFCFCFFYFHKLSMSINFICQKKCLKFHKIKFFFGFNQPEFCFVVSRFFFYLKKTQIMCVFQIRSKRPPNKFFFSLWKKNR